MCSFTLASCGIAGRFFFFYANLKASKPCHSGKAGATDEEKDGQATGRKGREKTARQSSEEDKQEKQAKRAGARTRDGQEGKEKTAERSSQAKDEQLDTMEKLPPAGLPLTRRRFDLARKASLEAFHCALHGNVLWQPVVDSNQAEYRPCEVVRVAAISWVMQLSGMQRSLQPGAMPV